MKTLILWDKEATSLPKVSTQVPFHGWKLSHSPASPASRDLWSYKAGEARVVIDSAFPRRCDSKKNRDAHFFSKLSFPPKSGASLTNSRLIASSNRSGLKTHSHQIEIWNEYSSELSQPSLYKFFCSLLPFNLMRLPTGSLYMKGNNFSGAEPI